MSKSVRISESFHEFIESHSRDDETIEETLRRLVGGPDPDAVSGIISTETATTMREQIETKGATDVDAKQDLREPFE